jgi:hypothetical protein
VPTKLAERAVGDGDGATGDGGVVPGAEVAGDGEGGSLAETFVSATCEQATANSDRAAASTIGFLKVSNSRRLPEQFREGLTGEGEGVELFDSPHVEDQPVEPGTQKRLHLLAHLVGIAHDL